MQIPVENIPSMSFSKSILLKNQLHRLNSKSIEDLLKASLDCGSQQDIPDNEELVISTPKSHEEKSPIIKSYIVSPGRYRSLSNSVHSRIFKGLKLEEAKDEDENGSKSPFGRSLCESENETDVSNFVLEDHPSYETIDPDNDEHCTIKDLVFRLAVDGDPDLKYVDDFLITYRYFVEAEDVARLLIIKYLDYNPKLETAQSSSKNNNQSALGTTKTSISTVAQHLLIQLRIVNVFRRWVDHFICDFEANQDLSKLVLDFLKLEVELDPKKTIFTKGIVDKINLVKIKEKNYEEPDNATTRSQKSMVRIKQLKLEVNFHGYSFKEINTFLDKSFSELDDQLFAEQLTLLEFERFQAIRVEELFHQAWNKKNATDIAPNLTNVIDWFNRIAYGVAGIVVSFPQIKSRIHVLRKLITIAHKCFKIHNYNTVFQIMAGLNMAPISRLKKTWNALTKKHTDMWEELCSCMSNEENHSFYRKLVKGAQSENAKIPIIPYVGLTLTDLTFAEDGNPTYKKNKVENLDILANASVNFSKFRLIGTIIQNILSMQTQPFDFPRNDLLLHWINNKLPLFGESEMFEMSLICEPKNQNQNSGSAIGRNLSNNSSSSFTS